MTDLRNNPAIQKLIEFAKDKKVITFEEMNDLLPPELVSPDLIDDVMIILGNYDIRLQDELDARKRLDVEEGEEPLPIDPRPQEEIDKENIKTLTDIVNNPPEDDFDPKVIKKLNYIEKESAIDDPIRLYLREIGRENLLTAEKEVELSKKWKMVKISSNP